MKLCICQIIKDEHPYIEEWIEYHYNLGFEKFYLIEDWNSLSHKSLLNKYNYVELYKLLDIINYEEKEILLNPKKYFEYTSIHRQRIVYHVFDRLWKNNYDWMAFIDVDEFIDINKNDLYKILLQNKNQPIVTMTWKHMDANNYINHPNNWKKYSVVNTYTHEFSSAFNTKQIINCNAKFNFLTKESEWMSFPHAINNNGVVNNYSGNIYLKHFMCKSLEEWIWRLQNKGESTEDHRINRKLEDWFYINTKYLDQKNELLEKYLPNDFKIKYNDYNLKI